jgi:hypothetical protein
MAYAMYDSSVPCAPPKTKKKDSATLGCVLPHVSRYITPNCIPDDQLTLKWKSGMSRNIIIIITKLIFTFQQRFLDEIVGVWMVWISGEGAL